MKSRLFTFVWLLCSPFALFAQESVSLEQLLQQIKALEARVATLEAKLNSVQEMNLRLRKVTDFGKPITETTDRQNGIKYSILSIVGDTATEEIVVTLRIEATEEKRTLQFNETHFVNLYGKDFRVKAINIAGHSAISYELQSKVPVTAELYFSGANPETCSEIKLLQFENVGGYPSVVSQFRNLQVVWR